VLTSRQLRPLFCGLQVSAIIAYHTSLQVSNGLAPALMRMRELSNTMNIIPVQLCQAHSVSELCVSSIYTVRACFPSISSFVVLFAHYSVELQVSSFKYCTSISLLDKLIFYVKQHDEKLQWMHCITGECCYILQICLAKTAT
jgi:hypothetical protein